MSFATQLGPVVDAAHALEAAGVAIVHVVAGRSGSVLFGVDRALPAALIRGAVIVTRSRTEGGFVDYHNCETTLGVKASWMVYR